MKTKSFFFILLFTVLSLNLFSQNFHKDVQLGEEFLHQGKLQQAYRSFEKAAKFGDLIGQYYLAKCFAKGYGTQQDEKRAFSIYRRAAERGLPIAQAELGYAFLLGRGVVKNISKGLYWIDKVEDNSSIDAYSSFIIGLCYENGIGKEKNIQKAIEYYEYSMSKNVDDAYIHCAKLYSDGIKVSRDLSKAEEIINEAINKIGSAFDWACKGELLLIQNDNKRVDEIWNLLINNFPFYAIEGNDSFCLYMREKSPIKEDLIQKLLTNNVEDENENILAKNSLNGSDVKPNNTTINITYTTTSSPTQPIQSSSKIVSEILEDTKIQSDVDVNIPQNLGKNEQTFAVIIANENYRREAKVPHANNDGEIFKEYCMKALGIPESNIKHVSDASLNDLKYNLNWLKQVMEVYKGEAKVVFYYAGHGIPNEAEKTAYLLPVDGYASDVTTGYSLKTLYDELGQIPSKSVLVLLDACFSGSKREGDMLASARGVAIKVKPNEPKGKLVVFSAAQGDETAYPYKEQGHGMFTYFLLKKLQESKGEATLGEISDYVTNEVRKQSIVVNGKMQTPTLTSSSAIAESWRNWKLK